MGSQPPWGRWMGSWGTKSMHPEVCGCDLSHRPEVELLNVDGRRSSARNLWSSPSASNQLHAGSDSSLVGLSAKCKCRAFCLKNGECLDCNSRAWNKGCSSSKQEPREAAQASCPKPHSGSRTWWQEASPLESSASTCWNQLNWT